MTLSSDVPRTSSGVHGSTSSRGLKKTSLVPAGYDVLTTSSRRRISCRGGQGSPRPSVPGASSATAASARVAAHPAKRGPLTARLANDLSGTREQNRGLGGVSTRPTLFIAIKDTGPLFIQYIWCNADGSRCFGYIKLQYTVAAHSRNFVRTVRACGFLASKL